MGQVFSTLRNACLEEIKYTKVYKSFEELEQGEYEVLEFILADTKFGPKIQVLTDDFYVFLPSRFSQQINTREQIDDLNNGRCIMIFKGKSSKGIHLDFKKIMEHHGNDYNNRQRQNEIRERSKKFERIEDKDEVDNNESVSQTFQKNQN